MRISTAEFYNNGISAIQTQQARQAETQQQLASGKRILSPSDDPAAAAQALELHERLAELTQYGRNADLASARLAQEESVLDQMGQMLQRARELTVQAANATQTSESRSAIAAELRDLNDALLAAANSRDANGEYLFGGFRSTQQPFVRGADGSVAYQGDGGRRTLLLGPGRTLTVGANGLPFMTIAEGNGTFTVTPDAANSGTGQVATADVTDPAAITADTLVLEFPTADTYEVRDSGGVLLGSGAYGSGTAIDVQGRRITLAGIPAAGDRFDVAPAGQTSMFGMLDGLATALEQPTVDAAGKAQVQHSAGAGLRDLDQALDRLLEARTSVGARLNAVDAQVTQNADSELRLQTRLSEIEDLDYAEAISRFQLQQVALQAAQQTYVQLSRLSLFDYIR